MANSDELTAQRNPNFKPDFDLKVTGTSCSGERSRRFCFLFYDFLR